MKAKRDKKYPKVISYSIFLIFLFLMILSSYTADFRLPVVDNTLNSFDGSEEMNFFFEKSEKIPSSPVPLSPNTSFFVNRHSQVSLTIDGNEDFHSQADFWNWPGDGSSSNPYLITGVHYNESGGFVWIGNTDIHFVIEKCTISLISDLSFGINFYKVSNGYIFNNTIERQNFTTQEWMDGILLEECTDIVIQNNSITGMKNFGIEIINSVEVNISDNSIYNCEDKGLIVSDSMNVIISNNLICNSSTEGMWIHYSLGVTIANNYLVQNPIEGIQLVRSNNSLVKNNTCMENGGGVVTYYCTNNTFENNYIDRATGLAARGIDLVGSSHTSLIKNFVKGVAYIGIIIDYGTFNHVSENIVSNCSQGGLLVRYSTNSSFINNQFVENHFVDFHCRDVTNITVSQNSFMNWGTGVYLDVYSNRNFVMNNTFVNNSVGISFSQANNNLIHNNSFVENGVGISMLMLGNSNIISNNMFIRNHEYAIRLYPVTENNSFRFNDFLSNGFQDQVYDDGEGNIFVFNFWDNHSNSDSDGNGIADTPYNISGEAINRDYYPLVQPNPPQTHHFTEKAFLSPIAGSVVNGSVLVQWVTCYDSFDHDVMYTLYYSDGDEWKLLTTNQSRTTFVWNTALTSNGNHSLKLITRCVGEATYGNELIIPLIVKNASQFWPDLATLSMIAGVFGVIGIAFFIYQTSQKLPSSYMEFFESDQIEHLKTIYHKVIIGLENISTAMITEQKATPLLGPGEPRAISTDFFPLYIKEDLKAGLRGRTVLTLIEIAYQGPDETNPAKLAHTLDIPSSTLSNEIKRLIDLDYLETFVSLQVMKDARFRNYKITPKGVEFLYIMKGALELSIRRLKERDDS
ncbi:MAG: right-handed parallel beta-helix repeat-containing protein [Candidatus Hodarchaeales archaeon]